MVDFLNFKSLLKTFCLDNHKYKFTDQQINDFYSIYKNKEAVERPPGDALVKLNKNEIIDKNGRLGFISDLSQTPTRKSLEYKIASKYLKLANSAERRELDFNLSFDDIKKLVTAKKCYYSGVELLEAGINPSSKDRTVDRINPNLGYVRGNVVPCCHAANQFKATIERGLPGIISNKQMREAILRMFPVEGPSTETLSVKHWKALRLKEEGLSVKEIATQLALSEKSVNVYINKAIRARRAVRGD